MDLLIRNLPFILQGLAMTLGLALATLFFATIISFLLGTLATLRFGWLRVVVKVYVELFRDIPLIVNIFFVFFVAPLFGLELSPFAAVTVGLSVWGSANGIEIVRGGFNAVPRHQWQSAAALGLKTWEIYLFITGPQALRAILPPFVGLLTLLVQATSLGALVGVNEFFKVGQIIVERTTMMEGWNPAFTVYAAVLLTYFVICSTLSWFGRWLERRLQRDRPQARPEAIAPAEAAAQLP
jgi:polar amino acid transport system permease protein